jgi:serine/threonine-protein kinase
MTRPAPDADHTVSVDTEVVYTPRQRKTDGQFAPGTIIAKRYRIAGILGSGGMGEVYRADDTKLGQQVALKFLPARLARNYVLLERLHDEVRLGRLITHPNVCRIYDIVEWDDAHFVAMEYVDGEDLSRLLRRIGRLPSDKAVDIARRIAAGLSSAHAKGILHRDLKPANVMIDSHGDARIMDFGLALNAGDDSQNGVIAGTPAYIAPEQLEGAPASVQSDLYALGLIMYELVTGRRVHAAKSFEERVSDLTGEIARPSTVVRDLDPRVEAIILRCLSDDPQQRPRSAREVILALPGGDPLAAAIAAGETPSPRQVAAAEVEGSLKPAMAWSLMALVALEIGFAFHAFGKRCVFEMLRPKSPEVLLERASDVSGAVGLAQQKYVSRGWSANLQQLAWIATTDDSPSRWERLRKGPSPATFWVRREPRPLLRDGSELAPAIDEPPQVSPGASTIVLDPRGRLVSLTAIPETSWSPRPADWAALFGAAGLDLTRFAATEPRSLPPTFADARVAWNGTHPDDGTPIRIEAAMWRGTPVSFRIAAPWDDAPDRSAALPFAGKAGRAYGVATSVFLLVFAALGVLLAWRNLRMRRGDRQGAMRVAALLFVLQFAAMIGFADHALSIAHETRIVLKAAATSLLSAAGYFLVYIALEPFVRRRWPDRLISWARLLSGNWRDPMVGRDVLVGIAAGLGHFAVAMIPYVAGIAPIVGAPGMLRNALAPFAGIAKQTHYGIVQGLTLMIALMILTIVLRRRALASLALFALVFAVFHLASSDVRMLPVFAVGAALVALTVARFGLLASVVYCATFFLFITNVLPTEVAWYTARGLVVPVFIAIVAMWAVRTALGSRWPWPALRL